MKPDIPGSSPLVPSHPTVLLWSSGGMPPLDPEPLAGPFSSSKESLKSLALSMYSQFLQQLGDRNGYEGSAADF